MLNSLVESNAALRKEIDTLDEQLAQYRYGDEEGNIPSLVNDLNRIKIVNGLIEVSGPGVELTLGGPLAPEELQDIINELRNAGAEAIVLNERRIIVSSVVALDPSGLVLDGAPLLPPYRFAAIGDPETLSRAVDRRGGLVPALLANHPGIQMELQKKDRIVAPIFEKKIEFQYAKPAPEAERS
ncbi:MAG: DUF881 domain-containing protein [Chloroflexota bacterium]